MHVHEIMTRDVTFIPAGTSIVDAAVRMHEKDVGMLPVVRNGQTLLGIVTDRDIAMRAVASGLVPQNAIVDDVMSPHVICCREDQSLLECARIMQEHRIRRLIVLNGRNQPVGVVSLADLAQKAHDDQVVCETLRSVSSPGQELTSRV